MRKIFSLVLSFPFLFFLPSCDKNNSAPDDHSVTVNIGFAGPLTGNIAHLGKDCENGVALAIRDLNQKKIELDGRSLYFRLVSLNDGADPRQATSVAQRLVDARVVAVIGHLNSGETLPASFIYARHQIPQLTVSSTTAYTKQGFKTAFRIMANDAQQGGAMARFAVRDLKLRKFVVIDDQTAYGQGLADIFVRTVKVLSPTARIDREYATTNTTDFGALLVKIKRAHPDAVFFGGMDAQTVPLVKQMRQLGLRVPLLSGDMSCTAQFVQQAGDAAPFFCSTNSNDMDHMPQGRLFKANFKAVFHHLPLLYAPYTYDGTMLIAFAIQKTHSVDPQKISSYLHQLEKSPYSGTTGDLSFDPSGDLSRAFVSVYALCPGHLCLRRVISSEE